MHSFSPEKAFFTSIVGGSITAFAFAVAFGLGFTAIGFLVGATVAVILSK